MGGSCNSDCRDDVDDVQTLWAVIISTKEMVTAILKAEHSLVLLYCIHLSCIWLFSLFSRKTIELQSTENLSPVIDAVWFIWPPTTQIL